MVGTCAAGEIKTLDGTVYSGTISRVEPDGIVMMTEDGIVKIPMEKLSQETQREHGYDPAKAATFAAETAAQQAAAARKAAEHAAIDRERKEQARIAEEEEKASEIAQLTVTQVLESGFLAEVYFPERGVRLKDDIYVEGPTDGLVDESRFDAKILRAGTFKFTTVLGASRTVAAYRLLAIGESRPTVERSYAPVSRTQSIGGGQ